MQWIFAKSNYASEFIMVHNWLGVCKHISKLVGTWHPPMELSEIGHLILTSMVYSYNLFKWFEDVLIHNVTNSKEKWKESLIFITSAIGHQAYGHSENVFLKEIRCRHIAYSFNKQQGIFYMHFHTDRTAHTTAFDGPVVANAFAMQDRSAMQEDLITSYFVWIAFKHISLYRTNALIYPGIGHLY